MMYKKNFTTFNIVHYSKTKIQNNVGVITRRVYASLNDSSNNACLKSAYHENSQHSIAIKQVKDSRTSIPLRRNLSSSTPNQNRLNLSSSSTSSRPSLRDRVYEINHAKQQFSTNVPNKPFQIHNELIELRQLIEELSKTNSILEKIQILQNHSNLEPLLSFLFHRHTRLYLRSDALKKRILETKEVREEQQKQEQEQDLHLLDVDLLTVFRILHSREITGNKALDFLINYLHQNGILENLEKERIGDEMTLLDVFLRCLERNLKVGVNERILKAAFPRLERERLQEINNINEDDNETTLSSFNVALGRPIMIDELEELLDKSLSIAKDDDDQEFWFISRKLDGVRCILQIDLQIKHSEGDSLQFETVKITPLSRNGRPFHTLKALTNPLSLVVADLPIVGEMVQSALERSQWLWPEKHVKDMVRLYLDGEVCMLVPQEGANEKEENPSSLVIVEDFQAIVGPIKRKDFTIPNPVYFPFDILTFDEFQNWLWNCGKHDNFQIRIERLKKFIKQCHSQNESLSNLIFSLEQEKITNLSILNKWRESVAKNGWEGLILRKGGKYEGKRTSSIRKLKDWQESEYIVQSIETAKMRLSVGQKYAERQALSNVTILHKGIQVKVGSGFSVEQRIKYAENPELIIGKSVTVAYFGESRSIEREDDDQLSLRFPTVKMVWEEEGGKRTI